VPPQPDRSAPSDLRVNLTIALLCLIWGSTWIVIKQGLADLPPLSSAGARFALAALLMCLLAPVLARREGGAAPPAWLWVAVGTLNFAISYALVYQAETVLPSGLVSLLWSVFPLLMAASGHWFLPGERLTPRRLLGFLLGFLGVFVLFRADVQALGPRAVAAGALLLLSPLVSAVGQTLVKRHGQGASSVLMNRNAMLLGAALLLLAAGVGERGAPVAWTPTALFSIGYLAAVGTVLAFGLYFWILRYAPSYRVSLIAYVTPAIALTLGSLVGGEPFAGTTLAGSALVLLGVVLVVRRLPGRAEQGHS
jgi:drug/metabolite transporter (DMT)-like permease